MINELLTQIGLSDGERTIYLLLGEFGASTAQRLSRVSKIARSSVYFFLEELEAKGLCKKQKKRGTSFFELMPAKAILDYVDKSKRELVIRETAAKELLQQLPAIFGGRQSIVPTLQFVEGEKNLDKFLWSSLPAWHESMLASDNIWWGYQDSEFVIKYKKFLEHYWSIKNPKQKIFIFSNQSLIERKLKIPNRIIRSIPKQFQLNSVFWLCGEYVITLMHQHSPPYAFQLKDPALSSNLRAIFQMLWNKTNS
jgi:hypothetical protein